MVDSVFIGFIYCVMNLPALSPAFQIMFPACLVLGIAAGVRLSAKWHLFAGLLLVLALVCEGLCRLFEMELVFPFFFTGMMALCVLAGDLIGTVIGKILKKG
jgi:thiosulfate reductase cytochrome b subunit